MRISKYVGDLLFEYECVVIPGFGGFISNAIPAGIDDNQHNFNPPSKNIVFNANLRVNDGLLINHIATSEGISYSDARMRVESFVRKCSTALEYGKRIHFHKIGWIEKNYDAKLEFDPDHSQNYNADAFGLSAFISPPVKREQNIRINKKFRDRKPAPAEKATKKTSGNKEPKYISINLMTVLILAIITTLFVMNYAGVKSLYKQYGSSIPFFYNTAGEYVIYNLDSFFAQSNRENTEGSKGQPTALINKSGKTLTKKAANTEVVNAQQAGNYKEESDNPTPAKSEPAPKEVIAESTPEPIKEEIPAKQPVKKEEVIQYHIIAGSFKNKENAKHLVGQLTAKGFGASIIGQNRYGMYRVSFEGFARKKDAEKQLAVIRENENQSAWIHKI